MSEVVIVSGMATAIVALAAYIKFLHSQMIKRERETSKEHSERTAQVTECMTGMKSSVDNLTQLNNKLYERLWERSS